MIEALTRPFGGSALARDAVAGTLAQWYSRQLVGRSDWQQAADQVSSDFKGIDWHGALAPAFNASGLAARRIAECAAGDGIVVTAGQQPGLFGGPLYVLHKALTALALADALAERTGYRTAPVFWAATDDTDYAEANHVSVVLQGAVRLLQGAESAQTGRAMAEMPLGDLAVQMEELAEACGSVADPAALAAVRGAYTPSATVGGAYVQLLRDVFEPLGIAVLDAAHPAVRTAGFPLMCRALEDAVVVRDALRERTEAIRANGYRPQVADVPALSLVFRTDGDGRRKRVPVRDAVVTARDIQPGEAGPNVLLRPIVERAILPTVAYVGGAGEIGYFAQVSAVADALGVRHPRIIPRWSGTMLEPHVRDILDRLGATVDDFRDPHAMEGRVAREELSLGVRAALEELAGAVAAATKHLADDPATSPALARSAESMRVGVTHRLARLERRYAAAVKSGGTQRLRDVAAARASLFPSGEPQERILSYVPFLSKYGAAMIDVVRTAARVQVDKLMFGD
jgi:bacillithiol biosynthesis cysteine-adding enzyme BshC